jgi:glycosyltransferase involved in cell wall biosynthesis
MKKILYLEHNIDGTVGGSHYCLLEICRNIDRSKYLPVVCFFQENSLLSEFTQSGAEVIIRSDMKPFRVKTRLLGPFSAFIQAGVNMVKALVFRSASWAVYLWRNQIDLVHLNNAIGFDHDLMLAAWVTRTPCVVHERGIETSLPPATKFFSRRVDRVITISDAVNHNLLSKGIVPEKLLRIDDGIDPTRLTQETPVEELRQHWNVPENAPVIGIVGNIKQWKGQETVVRALIHLKKAFPQLRCFIVGTVSDPAYKERLDRIIDEHGLQQMVIFTGYQKRPSDLMALFDVCVHASVAPEPFGIVLLEAMGKGKPVIATRLGGPLEILVDGDTGYLTEPGNAEALAERVALLLGSKEMRVRLGKQANARMHEKYTIRGNIQKIESLYAELLGS